MTNSFDEAISELMARAMLKFGADPDSATECRRAARAAGWDVEVITANIDAAMTIAKQISEKEAA